VVQVGFDPATIDAQTHDLNCTLVLDYRLVTFNLLIPRNGTVYRWGRM